MVAKEQITTAIQQGIADVEATFGGLSDAQLTTQVYTEPGGWTARDILAHLAGREQVACRPAARLGVDLGGELGVG